MTQETLMTEQAANTSEGMTASQTADTQATAGAAAQGAGTDPQTGATQNTQGHESGTEQGDKGKPEGAPEKYEFTAPDGVTYDAAVLGAFSEVAKDLNLSQEAAQKVLDKMAPVMNQRQADQIEAFRTEWADAAKADREYGGDKLAENLGHAKKALDTFGTPELRKLLDDTGLGNHPEVVRVFVRAGKAISEDGFVAGRGGNASKASPQKLYSASNMNP